MVDAEFNVTPSVLVQRLYYIIVTVLLHLVTQEQRNAKSHASLNQLNAVITMLENAQCDIKNSWHWFLISVLHSIHSKSSD